MKRDDSISEFIRCVLNGDLYGIWKACKSGVDVNAVFCENGATAATIACIGGDEEVLEYLCDNKFIDINKGDSMGMTPFMHAVIHNQIGCLMILWKYGVDIEAKDADGRTVLDYVILDEDISQSTVDVVLEMYQAGVVSNV